MVFTEDYGYKTDIKHYNMDVLIHRANTDLYHKMISHHGGFRLEITKTAWPYIIDKTVKEFQLEDKIKIIQLVMII